jgi:hypothetical protein
MKSIEAKRSILVMENLFEKKWSALPLCIARAHSIKGMPFI